MKKTTLILTLIIISLFLLFIQKNEVLALECQTMQIVLSDSPVKQIH
jgi:hypothetical protein